MRIGFDGTPLLGHKTGIGWYTQDLIEAVADQAPADEMVVFPISWRTARTLQFDPATRTNVTVVRKVAPARPLWAMWDRVPFPPIEWFVNCDVFHATNFVSPPSKRVPSVVTVHDIGFIHQPANVDAGVKRMSRLLPTVLRRAAAIIAVSRFTRDEIATWLPEVAERITVVPNGSHRRAGALPGTVIHPPVGVGHPVPPGAPYALMLGTMEPRKNVPFALDGIADLHRRGVNLRLVLAGSSSPLLDIDKLLRERQLGPETVVRTGYLDDDQVASLLAQARLLVFPSLYEGFGMPLIEAFEAGLPVVAARAGATPETVGGAGLLVEPGDTGALSAAMETAAFDDTVRNRLVLLGREQAALFSWTRAASACLDLYRQVAATHR